MEPVQVERFYLGCLAHASYMIGSEGIAAVIDPQRDVDIYIETAARKGWKIGYIIETHVHGDFVSGHRELAERTGAHIHLGVGSGAEFFHVALTDGDQLEFGQCSLQILATPGHTLESICVLMKDRTKPDQPASVFTGDTLFAGDVGRPDLSPTHTPQELASMLYRSIHKKLLTLPDETEVFPSHGAGSLCGRQMSSEGSFTIGKERQSNYALRARSSEAFVHLLTDNLPARPEYFAQEVDLNRQGATPLAKLTPLAALTAPEVLRWQQEGAVVLDTRSAMEFAVAHIPGSIHIALTGQYASWAARILGLDTPLIIAGEDPEHIQESRLRLARVGIEKVIGYLADGMTGWIKGGFEADYIPQITVRDFLKVREREAGRITVLDVREMGEVTGGAIEKSVSIPLGKLQSRAAELDRDRLIVVHCKGGYRGSIASSILRRMGFRDVANLIGGLDAWNAAGFPTEVPETVGAYNQ